MATVSCNVGPPFSANMMYVPVARGVLVKSHKYNAWIDSMVPQIKDALTPVTRFPVEIRITIVEGRNWHSDCDADNALKPLIDAIKRAGVIPDDRQEYVKHASSTFMPMLRSTGDALTRIEIEYPDEDQNDLDWANLTS